MKTSAPRSSRSSLAGGRLEAAGFALYLAIAVLPIAGSLVYGFLYTVGLAGLLARGFTLESWAKVLASGELWTSWGLSLYVAGAVAALSTAAGLALALAFRRALDRGPLAYAIYLPLALPGTVAGFLAFELLSPAGLFSRLAFRLGLTDGIAGFPALTNDRWALGIVATHAALATPFFALLFAELYRSERIADFAALSRSLGASGRQTLARVVVPILLSRAATNVLLLFVVVLGSYEIPLLLGRQSPQMLSVLTFRKYQRFDLLDKPQAFVHSILYTLVALAIVTLALGRRGRGRPAGIGDGGVEGR
jgi:putative spermidine/putrescine transport system permease protein